MLQRAYGAPCIDGAMENPISCGCLALVTKSKTKGLRRNALTADRWKHISVLAFRARITSSVAGTIHINIEI